METYNSIELTKQLVKDGKISQEIAETIFPELKESEDERIRKEMLDFFKQFYDIKNIKSVDVEPWIAWLEKQGEKEYALKSSKDVDVHKFVQYIERQAKAYELNLPNRSYDIYGFAKDILSWLEKQGSQNLANSAKTCKAEPKFKVGDWLIHNDIVGVACYITQIHESYYLTNEYTFINFSEEDKYHLWTIKDAKDGDVLVASDGSILLFKCVVDAACKHYIALTTDNTVIFNEGLEHYWETSRAVHPATKEQYDLLFQKMKETGYEWDAEKKELKKIEQKPAWSEEDDINLGKAIWYVENPAQMIVKDSMLVDWLKSLKERYAWKPSDKQMDDLEHIMVYYPNIRGMVNSIYADLKKLKG